MKTLLAIIVVAGTAAVVRAQSPQFEVVSVRPCQAPNAMPGGRQGSSGAIKSSPGRLNAECVTAEDLIREAWLRYPDGKPLPASLPGMNQPGLNHPAISRRLLNAPIEGVSSAYPKLQPATDGSCITWDVARQTRKPAPQDRSAATMPCGMFAPPNANERRGGVDVNGTSMTRFCADLSAVLDRDVVDKTGIHGLFDIHLDVAERERVEPDDAVTAPDPAQTFSELKSAVQRLGLKFEAATTPGNFLVIDRIEKPSEN